MKSFAELPDFKELRRLWKQDPIEPPSPRLELTQDSWVERGAEVIGWHFCRLEYWLSGNGWLRAWLRLNLFLSITLAVAGVLLLPPVNRVLEQLASSSHWLGQILADFLGVASVVPPVLISLAVLYLVFVGYRRFRHFRNRRGRTGFGESDGYYQ